MQKNQKKCKKICVYQKKAVLLHPLLNREHLLLEKNAL